MNDRFWASSKANRIVSKDGRRVRKQRADGEYEDWKSVTTDDVRRDIIINLK
jgi:hypothetical protein